MKQIQMTKNSSFSSISTKKIIQMNDVWTSYDSKSFALEAINMSIDRGANYAIVGVSGSGKSTLLKLLNGMMIPSKGTIKVDYITPNINNKKFNKIVGFCINARAIATLRFSPPLNMYAFLDSFPSNPTSFRIRFASAISSSGNFFRKDWIRFNLGKDPIKAFSNTETFFTSPKL